MGAEPDPDPIDVQEPPNEGNADDVVKVLYFLIEKQNVNLLWEHFCTKNAVRFFVLS